MAIQGFFTGDVKIRDLNGVLKAVDGIVEVATDAGTVTSVGIQVGSTGTDVNVANSPVTTSGNITLNLPTASATNRGLLSSADWAIFDAKQGSITLTTTGNNGSATLTSGTLNIPTYTLAGLGGISLTSLSASSPLIYDNTTGAFSIQVANGSQDGYLSSSDWTTFNSKQGALTFSSPLVNTAGTVSIPAATSSVNGYLTSTDWATFNNKQTALNGTGFVKISGTTISYDNSTYYLASNPSAFIALTALSATSPLSYDNTTGVFSISQATTSTNGYLSSTDWNTFNNKQAAGNYITALTGEATASGPGSASVTLSTSAVTGKILTGLNLAGGGTIAATDSILQAFGKVQNQISGMVGGVTFQGTWNASTNTPTLTSSVGTKGYYYIVDVAGSTNLNGITDWKIGDWAIFNGTTWDKVDNTDAVSSVNGFTGAVSLTTSNIAEGTNLYYLDSRARLALSFTAGSGAYDNTTGVITIPTNTSQLTNGANFITLSSLSASSPLSYNSGTGAFSIQVANGSQNGYLSSSDWTTFNSKQNAITLTTTGSSGSSTLVGATLNVPTYTLSGLGGVPTTRQLTINGTAYDLSADRSWSVGTHTGSLTSGYIPKANGTTSLTDSLVYDTGTAVLIGTTTASTSKFMVYSTTADNHYQAIGSAPSFRFADTITSPTYTGIVGLATASNHFIIGAAAGDMVLSNNTTSAIGNFLFGTGATERMRISPAGNVSINNTNNTYRFDVNGTVRFTGQLRLESTITDGTYTYTLPSATGTLALTSAIPANPVGGTGTTNYLPKFTGTSTIGDSAVTDDGTTVSLLSRALSGTSASFSSTLLATGVGSNTVLAGTGLKVTSTNSGLYLNFSPSFTGGVEGEISSSDNGLRIVAASTSGSPNSLRFLTSNSSGVSTFAMAIDGKQNLGLGVTPSAWSLGKAIEIGNIGNAIWSVNATQYNILHNAYYNGGYVYATSNPSSYYQQASGGHGWYTAPSGTAGNAITFTPVMYLNASGNLSVGNTNDTYKLDVSGTGIFTTAGNPLRLNSTSNDVWATFTPQTGDVWRLQARTTSDFIIYNETLATFPLTIASTGAATFSSIVGIGMTPITSNGGLQIGYTGGATPLIYYTKGTTAAYFGVDAYGTDVFGGGTAGAYPFIFVTSSTERMRITSGGILCVGKTDGTFGNVGHALFQNGQVSHVTDGSTPFFLNRLSTDGDIALFYRSSSSVGSISVTTSSTSYNTSSDYRLKQDLKDFSGIDLVNKIKTYDYEWKSDKSRSYGVIAHELQSVINYAVTGVKDGEQMQGVDYSKIVPVLIKAIQELNDKIK